MNAVQTQCVVAAMQAASKAPHNEKTSIWKDCADELGVSVQTVYRWRAVLKRPTRKRREDAGESVLTWEEARDLCGAMMEATRGQGKRTLSLEQALEDLRSNGLVVAGATDEETGELTYMSVSAVRRAMKAYRLWPDMLRRPSPKQHLKSLHPNHVWQIDPSLCVMYYLPVDAGEAIQIMDEKAFYKNKPANIRRIEKERVWRYVVTDHTSGCIYVQYVLGAESGKNLVDAFIGACQPKTDNNPFCGLPKMVMVDPGSANTGAVFRNLCRHLDVHLQVNEPHHPWAKGQVENANNLVECYFEHRLAFMAKPPTSLEEINHWARAWMCHFNAHKVHGRTGLPRFEAWLRITEEQLILPPVPAVMRRLATRAPVTRKVSAQLTISYSSRTYSVAEIPGVMVGETLDVTENPWRDDACQVLYRNEEGREVMQALEPMEQDINGFFESSTIIGEEYRSHKDSLLDTNRKSVERRLMGADTDAEAITKRRAKTVAFGGAVDPMKPLTDKPAPTFMNKRGTEHQLTLPDIEAATLSLFEAAKQLARMMGSAWTAAHYRWLQQRYPDGVKEDALPRIERQLMQGATPLRQVQSGGAE